MEPIRVELSAPQNPVRVKQYPISLEGRKGLKPVIDRLLKQGLLEPCMSPHNTPILPVKKSDGTYRLVQDLRAVNQRTQTKFPVVPNPYTLVSRLSPEYQWYSVIDLKDAFWACPLDEASRDYFAFEWEDPETGRKQQLRKLQYAEQEVKYLGHWLTKGEKRLDSERVAGILGLKRPRSKKEVRQLLGLLGYCRQWIEGYSEKVKFLYEKLLGEKVTWKKEDEQRLEKMKTLLIQAPVLSLPDLEKPFLLFVNVSEQTAYGVLVQDWAGMKKPVAYCSKLLDPVSRGWPACVQSIVATALLVEEARKITFNSPLKVFTPHNVRGILQQKAEKWLTDSRMLKYEAILIDSPQLELGVTGAQNPAQFLFGEPSSKLEHDCLKVIELEVKVRSDLKDYELREGEKLFIDGSSRVIGGQRKSGYAIVGTDLEVKESGPLSPGWSAQACELYALCRALELLEGKVGTIYTDSKYAFGVVHTFGKIWEERGLVNTQGKGLIHQELVTRVLKALRKPLEIAVVRVKGHQKGTSYQIRGNNLADEAAKQASLGESHTMISLLETEVENTEELKFTKEELKKIETIGT
ncbi:uncharacterized protein LOC135184148 [Pogoniulus pusillus]|uniref:uncharacterized protein LOC135184148 n=1 Tax=Pogoniulus pusillus TaxID=488313 RepID=UPI0030B9957A